MKKSLYIILVIAFSFFSNSENIGEKINNYDVNIQLNKDGTILVTETIDYYTDNAFKHGIYRDIPTTDLKSFLGINRILISNFKVLRDNKPESFVRRGFDDGVRYRIGSSSTYIPHQNRYVISYKVYNVLKEEKGIYQIYWNAVGQFWDIPIDRYKISVTYKDGDKILKKDIQMLEIYTGSYGNKGYNYNINDLSNGVKITSKEVLNPHEGITVLLNVKTDKINPTWFDKVCKLFLLYKNLSIGVIVIVISIIYSIITWLLFGKDPAKKIAVPEFKPHNKYSAMLIAYVNGQRDPVKLINIGMFSLIAKGAIEVVENKNKESIYQLDASGNFKTDVLFEDEYYLYNALNVNGNSKINGDILYSAANRLILKLEDEYYGILYKSNKSFTVILKVFILFFVFLAYLNYSSSKSNSDYNYVLEGSIILLILWAIYSFYKKIIGKPTNTGVDISKYIDGLKMYVNTAEKHKIIKFNDLKDLVSYFKEILPFAIALDISNECIKLMEKQIKLNGYDQNTINNEIIKNNFNRFYFNNMIYSNTYRLYNEGHQNHLKEVEKSYKSTGNNSSGGLFGGGGFSSGGGFSGGGFGGGGGGSW